MWVLLQRQHLPCHTERISRTWVFGKQCSGDDRSGIIVIKKYCHYPCCEGSCLCVWFLQCTKVSITKDLIHLVRLPILSMHCSWKMSASSSSSSLKFLESGLSSNATTRTSTSWRRRKEKGGGNCRGMIVEQRTSKRLYELLAEQVHLETVQMAEQETARQLIAETSQKLSAAIQGTANNLQGAKVAQTMLSAGNAKLNASTKQLADIKRERKNWREAKKTGADGSRQKEDCWQCYAWTYIRTCCQEMKTSLTEWLCQGYTLHRYSRCFREWTPLPMWACLTCASILQLLWKVNKVAHLNNLFLAAAVFFFVKLCDNILAWTNGNFNVLKMSWNFTMFLSWKK